MVVILEAKMQEKTREREEKRNREELKLKRQKKQLKESEPRIPNAHYDGVYCEGILVEGKFEGFCSHLRLKMFKAEDEGNILHK